MKRILFCTAFVAFAVLPAFADSQRQKDTMFNQLGIDVNSVTLVKSDLIAEDLYKVELSFTILPANSCQNNYAGLYENDFNKYTVIHSTTLDERCKMFARPRTVEHTILVLMHSDTLPRSTKLTLNGNEYLITETQAGLNLTYKQDCPKTIGVGSQEWSLNPTTSSVDCSYKIQAPNKDAVMALAHQAKSLPGYLRHSRPYYLIGEYRIYVYFKSSF